MTSRIVRRLSRLRARRAALGIGLLRRSVRLTPVSREWGFDRGTPVDRFYIERYLQRHGTWPDYAEGDIAGAVLEIGSDAYTRRFGGSAVTSSDVLHVMPANSAVSIVGDLVTGAGVPAERFDCVICTQTVNVVPDPAAAISSLHRTLRPGGVLLLSAAGICHAARPDRDLWGDYWRFTSGLIRQLLEREFRPEHVRVEAYGNLASVTAFLYGLAAEDLRASELELRDPDYELVVVARAQRAA